MSRPAKTLRDHIEAVEPFTRFLTIEETRAYAERVHDGSGGLTTLDLIGESRQGRPLQMVTVGAGAQHGVVIGMPHPNEPVGSAAALRLLERVIADADLRDSFTWHVIPCADPDGGVLNEGWFGGPFTRVHYASHLYRPPSDEQFEWTFAQPDGDRLAATLPESRAVMSVLDTLRPELVVSMHNSEVGGLYCYVTGAEPAVSLGPASDLSGVPIDLGPAEQPSTVLEPGVHLVPANLQGPGPWCSTDYAAQYGTLGVTTETPLWVSPHANDGRPADAAALRAIDQAAAERRALSAQHAQWVAAVGEPAALDSVLGRAVLADAETLASEWPLLTPDEGGAVPSRSYAAAVCGGVDLERCRAVGHLVRLLGERERLGVLSTPEACALAEVRQAISQWSDAAGPQPTFAGLSGAVRAQVAVVLTAAAAISQA